jgi:hypothetical protein
MEKLSDVIAKLQAVLDEHGDMPVASYDYYEEPCWGFGGFEVKVSEAHYPFAAHDETQGGKYVALDVGCKYLELP